MKVQAFKRQLARPDLIPWNLTHPTSSSSSFSVGNETVWPSCWPALAAVENRGLVTHGKCWQGRHWLIDPLERGVRAVRSIAFKVLPNASCRLWTTGMLQILEWCSLSKKWSKEMERLPRCNVRNATVRRFKREIFSAESLRQASDHRYLLFGENTIYFLFIFL